MIIPITPQLVILVELDSDDGAGDEAAGEGMVGSGNGAVSM